MRRSLRRLILGDESEVVKKKKQPCFEAAQAGNPNYRCGALLLVGSLLVGPSIHALPHGDTSVLANRVTTWNETRLDQGRPITIPSCERRIIPLCMGDRGHTGHTMERESHVFVRRTYALLATSGNRKPGLWE